MSAKYLSKRPFLLVTILVFLGIGFTCLLYVFNDTSNGYVPPVYTYYTFDPDTILNSLAEGDRNVFTRQADDFEPASSGPVDVVKWSQDDYLRIANALQKQFWQTNIENWQLHFMIFDFDCENIDEGPQKGLFRYYTITNRFFGKNGYDETISIDLSTESALLSYEGLSSRSQYSRAIDLTRLQISVHAAIQIAEDNGGRETRLRMDNNCFVSAVLSPYEINKGWNINYYNKELPSAFKINIDEHTGEYEVIRP